MARLDPGFGLVLLDERVSTDTLTAKGVGTTDSAYTEDEPIPGSPVPADAASTWRPQISGAQSVGLTLQTIRGGYAGREGAEVLWRLETDTTDADYRSWCDPVLITGFSGGASDGVSTTWNASFDTVTSCITENGILIIAAVEQSSLSGTTWAYDTRTGIWTQGAQFSAGTPGLTGPIGLAYDRELGRALLYSGTNTTTALDQTAYVSDDEAATWVPFGRRTLSATISGAGLGAMRIAVRPGTLDWLLMVVDATDGTGDGYQYASSDRGSTWEFIHTAGSATTTGHWPIWTGNAFLVAYLNSTGKPAVRLLASARALFDDAAEVTVDGTRVASLVVPVVDHDGIVYLYALGESGSAPEHVDEMAVYRSLDGGASWERYKCDVFVGGNFDDRFEWMGAHAHNGCVWLVGRNRGNVDLEGSIGILRLGGWDQVAHGAGAIGLIDDHVYRMGWGGSVGATTIVGISYHPAAHPDTLGWTNVGAAGRSLTTFDGTTISAVAGNGREYQFTDSASHTTGAAEVEVWSSRANTRAQIIAGVLVGPHLTVRVSDNATYEYEARVQFASDGLLLQDVNGAQLASVALTTTSTTGTPTRRLWTQVRILVTTARVDWWYRQHSGDRSTPWTRGTGGALVNGAVATLSRVTFGVSPTINTATDSTFRLAHACFGGDWQNGIEALTDYDLTFTAAGVRGHRYGKTIPPRSTPYPIGSLTASTEAFGYLSASGGPTKMGEVVQLPVAYRFPISAVDPLVSPSPRQLWRSTDTSEIELIYELGERQEWVGDALALLVLGGARPGTWELSLDNGAGGWDVIGTLELLLAINLTYTRGGDVFSPAGGNTISRYFREDELAGGYVVFAAGASARTILRQSAGYWGGTRQQVRLTLDGITGAEATSGTDLQIYAPGGVMVAYPTATPYRRWARVRAAAAAVVPDSKYQAGIIAVGRVAGLGADPAWGWSSQRVTPARRVRTADGVPLVRQLGPQARIVTYSWPEYLAWQDLREGVDYVAEAAGVAFGSGEDAAALTELLAPLRAGEVPVVLVPRLPTDAGDTTITERDLFVYGRANGDLTVTGKYGTEGEDEIVTAGTLTVEEIA